MGPFKDFGEAVLVDEVDDGVDGGLGADDENFDGFAVGFGGGVELKRGFWNYYLIWNWHKGLNAHD